VERGEEEMGRRFCVFGFLVVFCFFFGWFLGFFFGLGGGGGGGGFGGVGCPVI